MSTAAFRARRKAPPPPPLARPLHRLHPAILLATVFGLGRLPVTPATWTSAAALLPGWWLAHAGFMWLALATAVAIIAGSWAAQLYARNSQDPDPSPVVIDEVAGQWLTLLPVTGAVAAEPRLLVAALLVFRLFDITKPWPGRWFERTQSGWKGIMLDDVAAGVYGAAVMAALVWLLGRF
ncbi:MAG: phosphatidylglycerophosphatase A [Alphaproteobacteria bacterium]